MLRELPDLKRLPRPVFARVESLLAGSKTLSHSHHWIQLSYAVSGVLEVRTAQGNFVAPPKRAVWVPAGVEHQVLSSDRAEMRGLYIDTRAVLGAPERCRVLEVSSLVRELILAVAALPPEYDRDGPDGRLVAVLLDRLAALPEVGLSLPLPGDERLGRVCADMLHAPDDPRTEVDWAKSIGMSERTMTRLFKSQTGLSFGNWRLSMRLLAALAELEAGRSVTAVALDCGYESTSAFIAAFKKRFGQTPGKFFHR
jgi:AraC-like DNA-binding protein